MAVSRLLLFLCLQVSLIFCAPSREDRAVEPPIKQLPPKQDAFYNTVSGFEKQKPGTILSHRRVPGPITLDNKNPILPKNAWQIQYRTQNSVGEPEQTMVTVLEPYNAKPGNLFVYHFFSDAAFNGCNPSLSLQSGTREDNSFTQLQTFIIVAALNRGWYVSVADDGGPQAAFGAGLQWGYSTLDSIRAVKQSQNITGISYDPTVTLYGYSGGASSAGWTTELLPEYAPELTIDGAAIGGLIPNFTALSETLNGAERSRFLPSTTLGLAHDYKNMSDWLQENLVPENEAEFRKAESQCFDSNNNQFANMDVGKYFKRGYKSLIEDAVPASVRRVAGIMGYRGTPKTPWYLYESVGDDASPIALTDSLYEKHCLNGAHILYERNPAPINHSMECIAGLAGAFEWLEDRHRRKAIPKYGCTTVGISEWSIRASSQMTLISGLIGDLFAWYGQPLGPSTDGDGKTNAPSWSPFSIVGGLLGKPAAAAPGNSSASPPAASKPPARLRTDAPDFWKWRFML